MRNGSKLKIFEFLGGGFEDGKPQILCSNE
jgi:hypothetical protein